jgi:signal transduction histidine kinase
LWETITSGHVWRGEVRNRSKDGTFYWLDTTIIPILDDNQKVSQFMAVRYDITTYKKAQEAISLIPQQILQAHEDERLRIAKEIHDDLGQHLVALKIYLASQTMGLTEKYPELKKLSEELKDKVSTIIEKTRDLSHELSPLGLSHFSLVGSIKDLIGSMSHDKGAVIKFNHRKISDVDLGESKIMVYRIIQGALMNVVKHARASQVDVSMVRQKDKICLSIKDNGVGFHIHEKRKGGLGLALMRERAKLIHSKLTIKSHAGTGTDIRLVIPIKAGYAEK